MTIAYWCVFIMICLPYVFNRIAKYGMPFEENRRTREYLETLEGRQNRADWAHRNTLEALPGFAAAIIIAQLCEATQSYLDAIAITYIVLRIAYGLFYIYDQHILRSLSWMASFACIVAAFIVAAL